jgi:hypothetical protein
MSDPKNPVPGDRSIDLTDLELHDITPDMAQRLLKLRDGHPEAIQTLLLADFAVRKQAGLSESEVENLAETWTTYQRIEQVLPAARKLVELLEETRLVHGATIAMQLGEMAHQVRRRSSKLPNGHTLLASFEALLDYQFGLAQTVADRRARTKADAETPAQPAVNQPV